jgi:LuxR family maltose regulon positive regulatory protein
VLGACAGYGHGIGAAAYDLLCESARLDADAMLTMLLNDLAQLGRPAILALDDYQAITNPAVQQQLGMLVERLPASMHLVLCTRSRPALPLARMRARRELAELRAEDLRFRRAETQLFAQLALAEPLPAELVAYLDERTEGWVAGLQILALALERRGRPGDMAHNSAALGHGQRHIMAYLVGEVLDAQPEALQDFLLQTSALRCLTGPLCDAVTGRDDGAAMLEQLERANIFVAPLDEIGHWFRYHALFAEAMRHTARQRLGEGALAAGAYRASQWYAQHGMLPEAIDAALAAGMHERAAALIGQAIGTRHYRAPVEYHTQQRWLAALPDATLIEHPALCLRLAMITLFSGAGRTPQGRERMLHLLALAERAWSGEPRPGRLGTVRAAQALVAGELGETGRAASLAREALGMLPEDEHNWHAGCLLLIGNAELQEGAVERARQTLLRARARFEAAGNIYGARAAQASLGAVSLRRGELEQAAEFFSAVYAAPGADLVDRGNAALGLAQVSYERNTLDLAEQQAREAEQLGRRCGDERIAVQAALMLAAILQALGRVAEARKLLRAALVASAQPLHARALEAAQARLALAEHDYGAAEQWYAGHVPHSGGLASMAREQETALAARLLLAQRRPASLAEAIALLEAAEAEARAAGRMYAAAELSILLACAWHAQGQSARALAALASALDLARPLGFLRLFLDQGDMIVEVLEAALSRMPAGARASYARLLLEAATHEQARQPRPAEIDALSPQELRILGLLARGYSNPALAGELVVSVNTVKTHIKSIYRKLGVSNRVEACNSARRLGLLPS